MMMSLNNVMSNFNRINESNIEINNTSMKKWITLAVLYILKKLYG